MRTLTTRPLSVNPLRANRFVQAGAGRFMLGQWCEGRLQTERRRTLLFDRPGNGRIFFLSTNQQRAVAFETIQCLGREGR